MKDYYQVLNVSIHATAAEIRKSFLDLAKNFHPDRSAKPEGQFLEIKEAYETLTDPQQREEYDIQFDEHLFTRGITNYEYCTATTRPVKTEKPKRGSKKKQRIETYELEDKTGLWVPHRAEIFGFSITKNELDRKETLSIPLEKSIFSSIHRFFLNGKMYWIRTPRKLWNGALLRVKGLGNYDAKSKKTGDLILSVELEEHSLFRISGNNVYCEIHVAPWEIALGCEIKIPTLEGYERAKLSPRSQNLLQFENRGVFNANGKRGYLWASIKPEIEEPKTKKEQNLWKAIAFEHGYPLKNIPN